MAETIHAIKTTRGEFIDVGREIPDGDAKTYKEVMHSAHADYFDFKEDAVSEILVRLKPDSID